MGRRSRSKSRKEPRSRDAAIASARAPRSLAGAIRFGGAAAALLAAWVAIDPRSIDAFDAPKALLSQIGLALAAGAALWIRLRRPEPFRLGGGRTSRAVLILFAAGLLAALLSAASSPRSAAAFDALRSASFFLLALGIGASLASAGTFPKLTAFFAAGALLNAVLVILASRRIYSPLVVAEQTQRTGLGALLGNAGHLGISLALAAVAILPQAVSGKLRWAARAALAVLGAGILATQTLSGLAALAGGAAVYLVVRFRRRAAVPIFAVAALMGVAVLASRPLRFRVIVALWSVHQNDWNTALSARAAPWLAGVEMIRARPALGIGPGNFGGEFIPARVEAESRRHQRLVVSGMATNSFTEAHCDYLEILAAIGLPGGLCLIAAFLVLVFRTVSLGRSDPAAAGEGSALAAGAIAAATWFPFQIASSAVWLLLLLGAAFQRVQAAETGGPR